MSDPTTRLFALLELLQAHDRVTGADLARELGIDLRTLQRYIARLRHLGIPVSASPGVGGAYRLRPGFRLPPLLLSNDEAFALSLGLRALRELGLSSLAPATDRTLAKLGRVLPEHLRESIRTVEDVVTVAPRPWVVPASVDDLTRAATAIRSGRRLRFSYLSHAGSTSLREIEPYAVLHMDDRWYLIGHCLTRADIRTFRLDRVSALDLLPTRFDRPSSFDARQYLADRLPFIQSDHEIDVWIDMSPAEAAHNFALWRIHTQPDGTGTRLRCSRDRLELFAAMLLSTGRSIVVHTPAALRDTFHHLSTAAHQAATKTPSPNPATPTNTPSTTPVTPANTPAPQPAIPNP